LQEYLQKIKIPSGFQQSGRKQEKSKNSNSLLRSFSLFLFPSSLSFYWTSKAIGLPKQIKMAIKKEEVMQILGTQIAFEFKGRVMRSPDNPR